MSSEIDKLIENIDEIKYFAPIGFELMQMSAFGPHNLLSKIRVAEFMNHYQHYASKSLDDYKIPTIKSVFLSDKGIEFNDSLSNALFNRKSADKFSEKVVSFDILSFLLKLSAGIKPAKNINPAKRFYPSGGGLHSLRIYVDIKKIDGIEAGIYLFNPLEETVDLISKDISEQDRVKLHCHMLQDTEMKNYSFEIFLAVKPGIVLRKYGEHGWKIILMEAGHIAQNFLLVGAACDIKFRPWSAFDLEAFEKMLRTDSDHEFLLYSLLGG